MFVKIYVYMILCVYARQQLFLSNKMEYLFEDYFKDQYFLRRFYFILRFYDEIKIFVVVGSILFNNINGYYFLILQVSYYCFI